MAAQGNVPIHLSHKRFIVAPAVPEARHRSGHRSIRGTTALSAHRSSARARAGLDDSYKYPLVVLESLESGWEKVVRDLTAPDGGND